jgi:8-oxo-dGTP pyrophosphatase MutT (NUDIX family)
MTQVIHTLYDSPRLSLKEVAHPEDGRSYIFSHETRYSGTIVAVIPFERYGEGQLRVAVRIETVPCWDGKPVYSALTEGVAHGHTPRQTAAIELREEAGYTVDEVDFTSLGTIRSSKSSDTTNFLYAVDVTGLPRGKAPGDGSALSAEGSIEFNSPSFIINVVQCPLAIAGVSRLQELL